MTEIVGRIITKKCILDDNDFTDIKNLLIENDFTPAIDSYYEFDNGAVTYCVILMESHFIIHTYPEHDTIYFNLFMCSDQLYEDFLDSLKALLNGEDIYFEEFDRCSI